MISQLINLSYINSFNKYRDKFNYSLLRFNGFYGLELRNIPSELFYIFSDSNGSNIFQSGNNFLITGSFHDIRNSINNMKLTEVIKSDLLNPIKNYEKSSMIKYQIGKKVFDFKYSYSMGVLNVTPDSFSDGGKFFKKKEALQLASRMVEEGVDIIDIGGESTRPGSIPIEEQEELQRVIPLIERIILEKPETIISVDTVRSNVARKALESGAKIVNDISAGTFDPNIFNIIKDFDASMVIMHIKGKPKTMQVSPSYENVITEIYDFLSGQIEIAVKHGIKQIFIDPGIGFGKRIEDNLKLLSRLEDFKSLGFPILIGVSRKSFIGNILNLSIENRDDASNALNAMLLTKGARVIRTHNFVQAVQTCKLYNSLTDYQ
ncbi:MAG: dihydropteroate synthase [Ignavibacteriae bacterium]|nr:MAG: dihydropteroate synthase [Chlorobiota bacterium]MBL1123435.1 dihydropteroate synthase [Ignavibacteriota bacterium]MCE7856620.1 dihydropteroate synthase [Ignavibacteria bacterium CHB3]MCZ7613007.1 dihydropteroate synthase [Ignavibacteriaceae bacterium]MEB2297323.1 dihydropteroate synthase [Ignavibacteria bacterium]